jgi:CheY-like chemotaxis protein
VAIAVRDDGVGMTADVASRAFDPFFTTKEPGKGTGLGLSTVYGIVRQSGGAVWIDSLPGAGTTVWIYLPRVDAAPPTEAPLTIPRPATHRATVLVAEDEPMVRDLVQRILGRAGYEVLVAADGLAALKLAERHAAVIELLVTDVVMPNLGGRDLARRILATHPRLPVLFLSGYAHDSDDLLAVPAPAKDFLQKPFANARLLEAVEELLERARRTAAGAADAAESTSTRES